MTPHQHVEGGGMGDSIGRCAATRQVCGRCNRRGWGFFSPKPIWNAVAGHAWVDSDICVVCFGELGDEKWIMWTDGLEILPMSIREQREFVIALLEEDVGDT